MTQPSSSPARAGAAVRWWRQPMLWLVVGGPAVVVVAASVTAVIAFRGADPVVSHGGADDAADLRSSAEMPAIQARNRGATATHAAEPAKP